MNTIKILTYNQNISADTITPVAAYQKLRNKHAQCVLLESNESGNIQNSKSIIGLQPLITIQAEDLEFSKIQIIEQDDLEIKGSVLNTFKMLLTNINCTSKSLANAFYGYFSYDSIPLFESIELKKEINAIPILNYSLYAYILIFDHHKDTLEIHCNNLESTHFEIEQIIAQLKSPAQNEDFFECVSEIKSKVSDNNFLKMIDKGIQHCLVGNVFQVVLSRSFTSKFIGDEFEVYRQLRRINPSPYLFFFDFGDFKLFGSSPEALVKIDQQLATVNPIAGTYNKTGNHTQDEVNLIALKSDPKENAEHAMLVDLARNDLSKYGKNTKVSQYKNIHQYSHLMHIVSEVQSEIQSDINVLDVIGSVFPAGTLSGAPKYKAIQIIDTLEPIKRSFYGGGIGSIGLDNTAHLAIMIRTIMSRNYNLHLQAGAGIVAKSIPQKELEEVNAKLAALISAIEKASYIGNSSNILMN